jgi:adenylate cyclase
MAEANRSQPEETRIVFRLGLHLGDLIVEGDDLYGDGVNVAARLEAEAPAGGIVISGDMHNAVVGRLESAFEDLGNLSLKNIERLVRAYRVRADGTSESPPAAASPATDASLALPDKPSIAVLPFQNMSGDPEQEYFADGIVEDIITALSHFRQLFVIARNSSFTYKGKAADIKQVGRDLGVRYVLEGSIRRAGNRIRVTGQLIDSFKGGHVWAERYDRVIEDIFEVQEEITRAIVAALVPQIDDAEISRSQQQRPANLTAHELAYRAVGQAREAYQRSDGALCKAAIGTAREAIALDPSSSLAWSTICLAQLDNLLHGRDIDQARTEGFEAGTRAIECDPLNHVAFSFRGAFQCNTGRFAEGLRDLRRGYELNQNDTMGLYFMGYFEAMGGNPEIGIELIEKAIRLSPKDFLRPTMHQNLSFACLVGRRYADGVAAALVALDEAPSMVAAYVVLAANHVGLGNIGKARELAEKVRQIAPDSVKTRLDTGWPCSRPEDAHRLSTFLRVAMGLEDPLAAEVVR